MEIKKVESAEEMNFAEAQENGIIYKLPSGALIIPLPYDDFEDETPA